VIGSRFRHHTWQPCVTNPKLHQKLRYVVCIEQIIHRVNCVLKLRRGLASGDRDLRVMHLANPVRFYEVNRPWLLAVHDSTRLLW
jgi:hypothetical protein